MWLVVSVGRRDGAGGGVAEGLKIVGLGGLNDLLDQGAFNE